MKGRQRFVKFLLCKIRDRTTTMEQQALKVIAHLLLLCINIIVFYRDQSLINESIHTVRYIV